MILKPRQVKLSKIRKNTMTTYEEIARALVSAGYLSDADTEAAVIVLEDILKVEAAEDAQDAAADDYSTQEDIVAEVENWAAEDALTGDYDDLEEDEDIIEDALEDEANDMDTMAASEAEIAYANREAASALVAAELIDEADLESVAAAINDARSWVEIE
jgi:hypothetical protein